MDFASFLAYHLPALEADEARHNMILGLLAPLGREAPRALSYWSFSQPGHCTIHFANTNLILTDLDEPACVALAEQTQALAFRGVLAPTETAILFTRAAQAFGSDFGAAERQSILSLTKPPIFPRTTGYARRVEAADGSLYADWIIAFSREVVPHDPMPERTALEQSAASAQAYFWIDDGEPVSVARIQRTARSACAISRVYTPPSKRGRGYAGSVTAAVAEHVFGLGKGIACLYVDQANPASNRCYAKIGFEPVCDCRFYPRLAV